MSHKQSTSSWLPLVVVALLLALAVGGFIWMKRPLPQVAGPKEPPPAPSLSPVEAAKIIAMVRAGVGYLENDKFGDAEQVYSQLVEKIPTEALPVRNLAIAHFLRFEKTGTSAGKDVQSIDAMDVKKSLDALLEKEPDAASTHWLLGKYHLKLAESSADEAKRAEEFSQTIKHFDRSTQIAPDNAVFWFQLYSAEKFHPDPVVAEKSHAALRRAYQLVPDNMFVATELLSDQNESRDSSIAETIANIKVVFAPLMPSLDRRLSTNLASLLDRAAAAAAEKVDENSKEAQAKKWLSVRMGITPLMQAGRSDEMCQGDKRRILVHPLEYALTDLSPGFYEKNPLPPVSKSDSAMKFQRKTLGGAADQLTDIRDVKVTDIDIDDKLDLLVLRATKLEVYQLDPSGELGKLFLSVDVPPNFEHLLVADLDQDDKSKAGGKKSSAENLPPPTADTASKTQPIACFEEDGDVVLYGPAGFLVLRNSLSDDGMSRVFEPVTQDMSIESSVPIVGALLFDADHDGDVDLMASTEKGMRLWSNRSNGTFDDASQWSVFPPPESRFDSLVAVDWDRDVDVDVVVAGQGAGQAGILESQRHGVFRWRPLEKEFSKLSPASQISVLEADGNRSWDLAAVSDRGLQVLLTRTQPAASVSVLKDTAVTSKRFERLRVADFDNDGLRDLVVWGKEGIALVPGQLQGAFAETQSGLETLKDSTQLCEPADVDGDGDIDLITLTNGKLQMMINEAGHDNNYLVLRCRGADDTVSGRVNRWALGTFVELKAGGMYQAQVVTGERTHFGLGNVKQPDVVRLLWTQGIPQSIVRPDPDQVVCEKMIIKGSCPFVYTWTGQQFDFFTDLLWAAPLGLQFADGVIAPDRPWEYLLIPGDRLLAKDNAYEMRITEELWEAAYFDQVELLAVDHPADVEVFSNEKVGPAQLAEFKIHTVRNRRPLVSAKNHRDRDLLPQLQKVDGDMAQPFDATFRQGLAESHYMEFDLGELPPSDRITLFLTGWIRPTDTSLNVALSHDPHLAPTKPPSIWVPDASGQWREAVPYMGFPGGKTKTIAVDLTRAFLVNDHRLRIMTSAELYWDEAFFTVNEEPVDVKVTPAKLLSADLHFRGFSALKPGPRNLPDVFDYQSVNTKPHWPPMRGKFTRYGDVGTLLTDTDARLVVMASGDEISIKFSLPESSLPEGWKRDFILHNVGWDKDADLNTVFGQTVEPLPFVGMPGYPYSDVTFPDDEAHIRYLREFQTRESNTEFWREFSP